MPPPHPKAGPPPDAFASTVLSLLQAAPGHRLCVNSLHAQLPRALIPPTKREGGKGNFQGWLAQVPLAVWQVPAAPGWLVAAAALGAALAVLPAPWSLRWLALPPARLP